MVITLLQTQCGENRCMQFRVIVVTDPQTHENTQKPTDNTLRASEAAAQCIVAQCIQCILCVHTAPQLR